MDSLVDKILIIGLGSIGKRHLENLKILKDKLNLNYVIAALRSKENSPKICENEFYSFEDAAFFEPDIVIVATPTFRHLEDIINSIRFFSKSIKGIFVEKPIINGAQFCDKIFEILSVNNIINYVAAPLRFHPVIEYLKTFDIFVPRAVRVIASSYLPDWRKGYNYKKHYSAFKVKGGGVIYELIHELDYIAWLFGNIEEIYGSFSGKVSDLEVHAEDYGVAIFKTERNIIIEYHVDFFSRKAQRSVELFSEYGYGYFDIQNARIVTTYKNIIEEKKWDFQRNDMYLKEMEYFLKSVINGSQTFNDFEKACEILKIADKIRG